jgi:hypothetical protein
MESLHKLTQYDAYSGNNCEKIAAIFINFHPEASKASNASNPMSLI